MTAETQTEPLEAVRELHVLYGIAMTRTLTGDPDSMEMWGYKRLASDLHRAMEAIAVDKTDPAAVIPNVARGLETVARTTRSVTVRGLYEVWAKNIRSILG